MADERFEDHLRHPRGRGHEPSGAHVGAAGGAACGDLVRVALRVEGDRVADVKFTGRGCAISQASASILTELVQGRALDEVKALTKDDLLEELGIPVSPARLKCALLGLKVLKAGIYGVEHAPDDDL